MPDKASDKVESPALLANDARADADPLLAGLKVIVNCAELPAAIVSGSLIPLMVYSALLVPADEITTLVPVADKVPVALLVAPTATLPKLSVAGVTANVPPAKPVPESAMDTGEAVLVTAMLPVLLPLVFGANVTLNV